MDVGSRCSSAVIDGIANEKANSYISNLLVTGHTAAVPTKPCREPKSRKHNVHGNERAKMHKATLQMIAEPGRYLGKRAPQYDGERE